MDQMQFGHMVFFQLVDDSADSRQKLIDGCFEHLRNHPGQVWFSAGEIADTDRDVNCRDFDVALHLVFDSRESHDAYQTAPRHLTFIDQHKESWRQVKVFDSVHRAVKP